MVIAIIGESCTGKSTLAKSLREALRGEVFSGKDYLRLAKDEAQAACLFAERLKASVAGKPPLIYVVSEREQLGLLPTGAVRVLMTCDLQTIKERFSERMQGTLPPPVAAMLEKKHGLFDAVAYDLQINGAEGTPQEARDAVLGYLEAHGFVAQGSQR